MLSPFINVLAIGVPFVVEVILRTYNPLETVEYSLLVYNYNYPFFIYFNFKES